jgi:hypothetical protein
MLSVQLPSPGIWTLDCEGPVGGHEVSTAERRSTSDEQAMVEHSSMDDDHAIYRAHHQSRAGVMSSGHVFQAATIASLASHECDSDQHARDPQSHSTHGELIVPCTNLLFTVPAPAAELSGARSLSAGTA